MALKDLLSAALSATPAENARRRATLEAALKAVDENPGASDTEILAAQIAERERKAATFTAAGQSELAAAERAEVDALRALLRVSAPAEQPKAKPAPAAPRPGTPGHAAVLSRTQMIIAAVAVVLLLMAGGGYYYLSQSGGADDTLASADTGKLPVILGKDEHTLGNPKAPILFLEYGAPSCPVCAHFNATEMPLLKKQYIDTGKVYYVFRVFPLREADGAAEAIAVCLPKQDYFQFLDLLFNSQKEWDPEFGITDVHGGLVQLAHVAGLGADKVDECISDKAEQDHINAVGQDGEARYNITGTPTFVINGEVLQYGEAAQWPQLSARLDALLAAKH